jgi:hypothetical protein
MQQPSYLVIMWLYRHFYEAITEIIPWSHNFRFEFACAVAIFTINFSSEFPLNYGLTMGVWKCSASSAPVQDRPCPT